MMPEPARNSAADAIRAAFAWLAFKRLSAVEADQGRSHQHEFNGTKALIELFGRAQPQRIEAKFIWLPGDGAPLSEPGSLTWYDARARHPVRSEYRLYYFDNQVTLRARPGDILIIARCRDGTTLVIISPGSDAGLSRIAALFGVELQPGAAFTTVEVPSPGQDDAAVRAGDSQEQIATWEEEKQPDLSSGDRDVLRASRIVQHMIGEERKPAGPDPDGFGTVPLETFIRP